MEVMGRQCAKPYLCCSFTYHTMSTLPLILLLGAIGPWQIVLIVVVLLLLFGGKKIPELMRGLGQGMKEFKDASKEENKSAAGADPEERK